MVMVVMMLRYSAINDDGDVVDGDDDDDDDDVDIYIKMYFNPFYNRS